MMIQGREITTAAELRAHYRTVANRLPPRMRLEARPAPIEEPEEEPETVVEEALPVVVSPPIVPEAVSSIDEKIETAIRLAREMIARNSSDNPCIYCARAVSQAWTIPVACIFGRSRFAEDLEPRQYAFAIASLVGKQSDYEIGRRMGGRDHSTILNGIKRKRAQVEAVLARMDEDR